MKIENIFNDLKKDLQSINKKANERLLKEEQVRSSIFCSLKNQGYSVAAERNFNKSSEKECDLVFWKGSGVESWMEIKTSWYSLLKEDVRRLDKRGNDTWNNKPREQYESWKRDIKKLQNIENTKHPKYFVLVEQCNQDSLFEELYTKNKYNIKEDFESVKCEKIEFELRWNKAPVDKCVVRVFDLKI
ncbi:hypothetical protein BA195_11365 [Tenacibaculum soleae]|uniref:Uncharacterized protein n=1 Tax=Tenacibaculum soleae TaxID=447689 RepID=A0A1B9XXC2_9FLAO|nr:hypothetical protein [Tenacibaculum soleae]OCK42217.1 hypothetical protein BA195_11365 [Tenacibaculum soleae]